MPAKSGKQYRFMQAISAGRNNAVGPSKELAREFIKETPPKLRSKFMKKRNKK